MTFILLDGESPAEGLRRLAVREVDAALEGLAPAGPAAGPLRVVDPDPASARDGVHDARRSLKRVRALLRLVRPALADDAFRVEYREYRDLGRALSPVRDAEVLVATAEGLLDEEAPGRRELLERLRRRRDDVTRRALPRPRRAELAKRLRSARDRVTAWTPPSLGWTDVEGGLRRTYAEGARAFRRARSAPADPERHHEWRKRAKDLLHQVEVLRGAWPPVLAALADEIHRLTTLLGEANDLAVLRRAVEEEPGPRGPETAHRVREAAAVEMARAWREAHALGGRIWAEAPAVFTARMGRYRETWRG